MAVAGGALALLVGGPLADWIYPGLHGAYLRFLGAPAAAEDRAPVKVPVA